jgi:hypothetical protein
MRTLSWRMWTTLAAAGDADADVGVDEKQPG